MDLKTFARSVLLLVVVILLLAPLMGCQHMQNVRFSLERVPKEYRDCASKVTTIPDGPLTLAQLSALSVKLRKSELKQNRCLKGVIRWADAQERAYREAYANTGRL